MGSKEEDVPNEPKQKAVFVEDMNEDELASAVCITRLKPTHMKTNNLISFSDGFPFWADKFGKHLLHECCDSMSQNCS